LLDGLESDSASWRANMRDGDERIACGANPSATLLSVTDSVASVRVRSDEHSSSVRKSRIVTPRRRRPWVRSAPSARL
jgi:hypothetical protein